MTSRRILSLWSLVMARCQLVASIHFLSPSIFEPCRIVQSVLSRFLYPGLLQWYYSKNLIRQRLTRRSPEYVYHQIREVEF
ncbi:hypothetical protein F4774DRAFT_215874 [Daldinia eschscholtzii]|nr:hypothetical protein F4774DRAFT_215874 [Daldinia eschscholtzii]